VNAGGNTPVCEIDEGMASTRLLETCWLISRRSTSDEIWETARIGLERITGARAYCAPAGMHIRSLSSAPGAPAPIDQLFKDIAVGWNDHTSPELILTDDARCAGSACAGKHERFGTIALEAEPGTTISHGSCLALAAVSAAVGQAIDAVKLDTHSVSGQIDELRNRLGRALHDGPSQDMATALLALEQLVRTKSAITEAPASVSLAFATLEAAIVSLRKFMGALRGEELLDVFAPLPEGAGDFPGESQEQAALAIVQEALRNVRKHAGAQTVRITIHRERHGIDVTIEDDGAGFEASTFPGHFGLDQMRERAEISGGNVSINSVPALGTEVRLTTPAQSFRRPQASQPSLTPKRRRDCDAQ
jgi:histidine kinase/DNA gyrase B/HSP90-like ATPase